MNESTAKRDRDTLIEDGQYKDEVTHGKEENIIYRWKRYAVN